MYQEDLTAETLFNEPQFVERYLEMLTEETSTPYIERLRRNKQSTDFTDETLEVVKLLDGRESQIRLLINYLSLIIENCQDKMVTQTDTIEQQERDIEVLKVENSTMKEELKLFRSSLEELRQKHSTMEEYLEDVEKRYENDKVIFNQTQLEIQILKGIKDELTESRVENSKLEKINEGLKENLHNLEEKLELLRVENSDLKENFEVLKHNLGKSVHIATEYEKIKSLYEKICKEQELERSTFVNERLASEENLGLVSQKCIQLQEELQKAHSLVSQKSIKRFNTVEDPALNLNARLNHKFYSEPSIEGSIVLDHDRASASRAEASFPSTDDTLENYAADQFDGIRTTPNKDASGHKKAKQGLTAQKFNTVDARGCYPIEETSPTRMSDLGSLEEERTSRSTVPNHLKPKRKNILEEFFLLTFQSSLLNSEHFNELAGIESSKLFDEVNKRDIPYFQWSKWLENKLQSVYNETILPKRKVSKVTKVLAKQGSKKKVMAA